MDYAEFERRYSDKQYIGSGGFGKVYKVFDPQRHHYMALKVADVRPEISKFTLKNEVDLVNQLPHHRNIARYEACYRFNTGFTGEVDFALLRFYEDGNLDQFLKQRNDKLSQNDKRLIISGVLKGVEFLHENNVIHRDLKAENILLQRQDGVWTPKITDFGLSRKMSDANSIVNSAIGLSYSYAAPEQIKNDKITKNVDVWAIGVIIYRIMADELPFRGNSEGSDRSTQSQLELSQKIVNLQLPEKLDSVPSPYQEIIRRCLVLDPEERAQTASELIDILEGNRQVEPASRTPSPAVESVPPEEGDEVTQLINPGSPDFDDFPSLEDGLPDIQSEVDLPSASLTANEPFEANAPSDAEPPPPSNSDAETASPARLAGPVSTNAAASAPSEDTGFQPKMGNAGSPGGQRGWMIGGLLAVLLIAAGAFFFLRPTPSASPASPSPVQTERSTQPAAPWQPNPEFVQMSETIATSGTAGSTERLAQIEQWMSEPRYTQDPILPFLLAMQSSARDEMRSVNQHLNQAVKLATQGGKAQATWLLQRMEEHETDLFRDFAAMTAPTQGGTRVSPWSEYKNLLSSTPDR